MGSIVGTGIFVSIGLAADAAGPAVLLAVLIAAGVATANGLNSAQLAASHPVSGGTYEYGYRYLTPALGFTAGWLFLFAKTASAATAALGFSAYLVQVLGWQGRWARTAVALLAVALLTALVLTGLRRSNWLNALLVLLACGALLLFAGAGAARVHAGAYGHFFRGGGPGLLEATALAFVAYTGYGRIATMGEEIREPARNIPRAMIVTLVASALLYALVAFVLVGMGGRVVQGAPLSAASAHNPAVAWLVAQVAMVAMLGVLLNLVLGLSRVWLAMGRRGDMPAILARVNKAGTTPKPAVVLTGVTIAALVLIGDIKLTWSFSAFTVLVYYAVTNLAALKLPADRRRFPRWLAYAGLAACLFLAFWVDWRAWTAALALIFAGLVWHLLARWGAADRLTSP
ncbi:MAG: amino acid permease [Planctomycetes bacterium]|nr:amino acid permease [Planctomycetota bacterium]MCW8135365.1 amino acid permease [Planctomycetota bacterium]